VTEISTDESCADGVVDEVIEVQLVERAPVGQHRVIYRDRINHHLVVEISEGVKPVNRSAEIDRLFVDH